MSKCIRRRRRGCSCKRPKCTEQGDHASAVAALQNLIAKSDTKAPPLDIYLEGSKYRVYAQRRLEKEELHLPVMNLTANIKDKTTLSSAVAVKVKTLQNAELAGNPAVADAALKAAKPKSGNQRISQKQSTDLSETAVADAGQSVELYMTPEWKCPTEVEGAAALKQPWKFHGNESMYPFWAVRRTTAVQLAKDNERAKPGEEQRFNCTLEEEIVTNIIMGGRVATTTRMITLPYLTNSEEVQAGKELLLEIAVKTSTSKPPPSLTWKDVAKQEAAKPKHAPLFVVRAAAKPAAATAPAAAAPEQQLEA